MQSAFAADASSWVTVTRYGAGADPVISGGGTVDDCVRIEPTSTGGWKFQDIRVTACLNSGLTYEPKTVPAGGAAFFVGPANGFWIQDVEIDAITGGPVNFPVAELPRHTFYLPTAFASVGVNYVYLNNVSLPASDMAHYIQYGNSILMEAVVSTSSRVQHAYLFYVDRTAQVDTEYLDQCSVAGYPAGSAGFFLAGSRNHTVKNSKFRDTPRPFHDGVGYDYETAVTYCVWEAPDGTPGDGNELTGNYGPAFLVFENAPAHTPSGSDSSNNLWVGTVIADNGKASAIGVFASFANTPNANVNYMVDTQIDLWHANQKTFDDTNPGTTDTPPAGWVVGGTVITGP